MTYRPSTFSRAPAPTPELALSPASCPSCRSTAVVSTAKQPNASGYWRCERCGEVWNPGRRQSHPAARGWRA
jgi:predicted Zn finger-like uncharacterized protein